MSGFGLETSDIDMCLLTKPFVTDPRMDALTHLDQVKNLLITDGKPFNVKSNSKLTILLLSCFQESLKKSNSS